MNVDPKTLRLVVVFLGLGLLMLVAAVTTLAALHTAPPQALDVALGTDLGALAALFVQPHSNEPTPVSVVGQPVDVNQVDEPSPRRRRKTSDNGGAFLADVLILAIAGAIALWLLSLIF